MNVKLKYTYKDYKYIYFNSKLVFKNSFCILKKIENEFNTPRLLIITSKKIGNAPYRNYIKRCTKELYKKNSLNQFKFDLIFIYRPVLREISFHDIDCFIKKAINELTI